MQAAALAQTIWDNLWSFTAANFSAFSAAALGAWLGAKFAFNLQHRKDVHAGVLQELSAFLNVQVKFQIHLNSLHNIDRNYLDEFRFVEKRHSQMKKFSIIPDDVPLQLDQLSFLLASSNRQVIMELHVAHRAYLDVLECTKDLREAREAMEKEATVQAFDRETGFVQIVAPAYLMHEVMIRTEAVYDSVSNAIKMINGVSDRLTDIGTKYFKQKTTKDLPKVIKRIEQHQVELPMRPKQTL